MHPCRHPVALAVAALQQALDTHPADSASEAPATAGAAPGPTPLQAALEQLRRSISAADGASLAENMTGASKIELRREVKAGMFSVA